MVVSLKMRKYIRIAFSSTIVLTSGQSLARSTFPRSFQNPSFQSVHSWTLFADVHLPNLKDAAMQIKSIYKFNNLLIWVKVLPNTGRAAYLVFGFGIAVKHYRSNCLLFVRFGNPQNIYSLRRVFWVEPSHWSWYFNISLKCPYN